MKKKDQKKATAKGKVPSKIKDLTPKDIKAVKGGGLWVIKEHSKN